MSKISEINKVVDKYEVVALVETSVEKKDRNKTLNMLNINFEWWAIDAIRKNSSNRGRASGGHTLRIKKVDVHNRQIKE